MNVNEKEEEEAEGEIIVIREEHKPDEFQNEGPSITAIDTQTDCLTPEQIAEFFKATEDGSIERLEQLFDEKTNADPNMTYFTESLLMAAIRTSRNEVAEYLIDQLAINVKYAADLREFRLRSKAPVRHRTFSCRDLAYEKGMMELVDLIDITSDDVTPNIKRYLKNHLKKRLHIIHQTYLKRLEEHNKLVLCQSNEEKENIESPTVNITDENIIPSPMLPTIVYRPYKSHIQETIQSIDTKKDKSIDEIGKKTFRFSNYTLRFRLVDTPNINNKIKEKPQFITTIPSLPIIPLSPLPSTPLITTNNNRRSISDASSRLSFRDSRASVCRSARRTVVPQIVPTEHKPSIITTTNRLLPKRVNQNNINYSFVPQQQQHYLFNQPRRFIPVTMTSTAIGLSSNARIIRD